MQNHIGRKEAVLEPTSSVRCIYTPPSNNHQLNQCKASFRKFTVVIIKPYTSQYNKNMIYNLSNYTPFFHQTEGEFLVLTKGLCFVLNSAKALMQEINKSWSKFKKCTLKQYLFRKSIQKK